MSGNTCIKIKSAGRAELVHDAPFPTLRYDYILVKTVAVALNPTDWKHIDDIATPGTTVGCDYSGIVKEVGSAVAKNFKPGGRVAVLVLAGQSVPALPEHAAFAAKLVTMAEELWALNKFKAHPFEVRSGGLAGVIEGLQELREGKVSGFKLVNSFQ